MRAGKEPTHLDEAALGPMIAAHTCSLDQVHYSFRLKAVYTESEDSRSGPRRLLVVEYAAHSASAQRAGVLHLLVGRETPRDVPLLVDHALHLTLSENGREVGHTE